MPELPEVETVRKSLAENILNLRIAEMQFFRKDLRFKIPIKEIKNLINWPIYSIRRRAKYLLFETENGILLSHLGMTGTWRLESELNRKKHDHCAFLLSNNKWLIFNDPRRFGFFDYLQGSAELISNVYLNKLGCEPLDGNEFTAEMLFKITRKKKQPVKTLIMDQKFVVGIGNIYACEGLFYAKVRPDRIAGRLNLSECQQIVEALREVLHRAIASGGSSIRNFFSSNGQAGYFQSSFTVYDRSGEQCITCQTKIRSRVLSGRSTFWCPECQI